MKTNIKIFVLLIITIITVVGCKKLELKNQASKLDSSVIQYGASLRWERHQEMLSFHLTRDGKNPVVNIEDLENFGVTSFQIFSKQMIVPAAPDDAYAALVVAEVKYFDKSRGNLRKITLNQKWWYNKEIKRWLIETDPPEFK